MVTENLSEHETVLPKPLSLLRQHFFTGLLVLMPVLIVFWILGNVVDVLWRINEILPNSWQPRAWISDSALVSLVEFGITVLATTLLAFGVSLLGWSSQRFLGRKLLQVIGYIIQRIPVIRSIYNSLDQFGKTIAAGGGKQFSRVVYVEYPRRDCWSIGFVTSPAKLPLNFAAAARPNSQVRYLNVYVPTTPNPTSGFHLILPESEVRDAPMTVEEAFKTIISLGIAQSDSSYGR